MKAVFLKAIIVFISLFTGSQYLNAQSKADANAVEKFVQQTMADNNIVGGTVTLFTLEEDLLTKGFGKTSRAGEAIDTHTTFNIGSLTKSFTGIAILQLRDAGLLNLNLPVVNYLPAFRTKNKELSNKITILHLLNHSSGITTFQGNRTQSADYYAMDALEFAVSDYQNIKLNHNPGDHFEYSNANYQILGLLIEKLSDNSYENYITDHILKPLAMNDSGFEPVSNSAIPHRYVFGFATPFDKKISRTVLSQGGIFSSAADMKKYLKAILVKDTALISQRSYDEIFNGSQPGSAQMGFAGWEMGPLNYKGNQVKAFWHNGSNPGFKSSMLIAPELGLGTFVSTNTDGNYDINSSSPFVFGPSYMMMGYPPPNPSPISGFLTILLWLIPIGLSYSLFQKFRKPFKKKTMRQLIISSLLTILICYFTAIFLPGYFGNVGLKSTIRFEPEVGYLLLSVTLLATVKMLANWLLNFTKANNKT